MATEMRRIVVAVFAALFAIGVTIPVAAARGPQEGSPWPQFQHNPQRTGRTTVNGPVTLRQKWVYYTQRPIIGGLAIAEDGTIYVSSRITTSQQCAPMARGNGGLMSVGLRSTVSLLTVVTSQRRQLTTATISSSALRTVVFSPLIPTTAIWMGPSLCRLHRTHTVDSPVRGPALLDWRILLHHAWR